MSPLTDIAEQIDHAGLRDFYRYWLAKRGGRRVPARADIDPIEIRRFLPNIFMLDVIDGGARFRYRLVGTAVGNAIGDYTGRYVDEALPPAQYAIYRQKYESIIRDFAIHYEVARVLWHERADVLYRRLMLPLSDDQMSANILLGVSHFEYGGRPLQEGQRIGEVTRIERIAEHTALAPPVGV